MSYWRLLLAASVLLVAACSTREPTAESGMSAQLVSQSVVAERVPGGVRVSNGTSSSIAYVVWDAGFLGLLGPCDRTGEVCPLLAAGRSATVSEGIPGFSGAGDALVYWWSVDSAPSSQPNTVTVGGGR
jgi:hypothetical protein